MQLRAAMRKRHPSRNVGIGVVSRIPQPYDVTLMLDRALAKHGPDALTAAAERAT